MMLLGFKSNWQQDAVGCQEYFNVISHGIDLHLAVAILRLKGGTDYSKAISVEENTVLPEDEAEPAKDKDPDNLGKVCKRTNCLMTKDRKGLLQIRKR